MTRPTRTELASQLDLIESLIRRDLDGLGLPAIVQAYAHTTGRPMPERTMLRRLAMLQSQGRIRTAGAARATRYHVGPLPSTDEAASESTRATAPVDFKRESADGYVPLSPEGAAARALIHQPIAARRPVTYNEAFLRNYQPGETWYLAEAARQHLHDLGRTPEADRPAGTFARDIFERLLIDLAWASSRLEGNTYSRLDTRNLLEHGMRAEGKDAADAQMILNHKKAIEFLVEQAEDVAFNRYTFLNLHAALAENLIDDPKDEGRIRRRIVHITGTTYVPLSIPQRLDELFDLLLAKAGDIPDPFEQAFFVMVHLPYLQPFADVNKRTSRLGANLPLIKANLCPLSFVGVPERAYIDGTLAVYEGTRIELLRDVFLWAYERSCAQYRVVREAMGEPDPIRLRYRSLLAEAVREAVREGRPPRLGDFRSWAEAHDVAALDRGAFAEAALGLLVDLHEGAISRYGLRPSEFQHWKSRVAEQSEREGRSPS